MWLVYIWLYKKLPSSSNVIELLHTPLNCSTFSPILAIFSSFNKMVWKTYLNKIWGRTWSMWGNSHVHISGNNNYNESYIWLTVRCKQRKSFLSYSRRFDFLNIHIYTFLISGIILCLYVYSDDTKERLDIILSDFLMLFS